MIPTLKRTNSENSDFRNLVNELDEYLTHTDEEAHSECKSYNKLETIKHVVIVFFDKSPIGCGAIRQYNQNTVEIKRMFVVENVREKGIGTKILTELEAWARELGFKNCILETGKMMPGAINLYIRNGYRNIPNYGQYEGMEKSICFQKEL
ncbi:MAG: GNAT family N-acetyltransferase [Paludibacteraceae bacterium]